MNSKVECEAVGDRLLLVYCQTIHLGACSFREPDQLSQTGNFGKQTTGLSTQCTALYSVWKAKPSVKPSEIVSTTCQYLINK